MVPDFWFICPWAGCQSFTTENSAPKNLLHMPVVSWRGVDLGPLQKTRVDCGTYKTCCNPFHPPPTPSLFPSPPSPRSTPSSYTLYRDLQLHINNVFVSDSIKQIASSFYGVFTLLSTRQLFFCMAIPICFVKWNTAGLYEITWLKTW
jgi:hypothetical protein